MDGWLTLRGWDLERISMHEDRGSLANFVPVYH